MKILIIGGNRFVGLRLSQQLAQESGVDLHIVNRTGQAPHATNATIHKMDRKHLNPHFLDRDWDAVIDMACFNEEEARIALKFFKNVGKYIFISTAYVYDGGKTLREEDFAPQQYALAAIPAQPGDYRDGKRRAEAVFAQESSFPVSMIRFPFILGPDDYTQRLRFHIERVAQKRPIYIPNLEATISLVSSEDAARFLHWGIKQPKISGPINIASPESLTLRQFLTTIETAVGHKALLVNHATNENHSPYGVSHDMGLDVSLAKKQGFACTALTDWLPELVTADPESGERGPGSLLH